MRVSPLALLSAVACGPFGLAIETKSDAPTTHEASIQYENAQLAQDPLAMGSMASNYLQDSPRHRQEKAHLIRRMDPKHGKWSSTHARYRLLEALFGFTKYRERNMAELDRWRKLYKNVGKKQKKTLEKVIDYTKKLDNIEKLIYTNDLVCKSIVSNAMQFYNIDHEELNEHINKATQDGRQADKMSVSQTLKHFVRDWAEEGSKERNEAFPCILSTLESWKALYDSDAPLKVLLPGSGLGRLGHEVANLGGFEVTLNEWSMYMNIGYRFINTQPTENQVTIHPFIDGMSHHAKTSDMFRGLSIPSSPPNPDVLLVEGDFNSAFNGQEGHYDIIVTHFFIDTARNLMAYFDTIHRLLKPGGAWVNFGPLLYGTGPFVQLSLDEILAVVEEMGFEFENLSEECGELTFDGKKVRSKQSEYGFNRKALTRNAYLAQAWLVRKM